MYEECVCVLLSEILYFLPISVCQEKKITKNFGPLDRKKLTKNITYYIQY